MNPATVLGVQYARFSLSNIGFRMGVNYYMEMEGGRFFLTFLAEALMELLEAEELTPVTLLLKKLFEAAGSDTPKCLNSGGDSITFAATQCVELLSKLPKDQFPTDTELPLANPDGNRL